jgi:hypothetical protein
MSDSFFEAERDMFWGNKALDKIGLGHIYFSLKFIDDFYEVAVNDQKTSKTIWFADFDEAHKHLVETYPNADWEETGWR